MVGLEVSVNGKRHYIAGVGEFGMLTIEVMWLRIQTDAGPIHEECFVVGRGMEGNVGGHVEWPGIPVAVGDEITLRVRDTLQFDVGTAAERPLGERER